MRLITAAILLPALAVILGWPWRISNDVGMYLTTAGLLLDGERLYVDIIDINPPLITYLNVLPAAAARALVIYPPLTFLLMVWAGVVCSTVATRKVLTAAGWEERAGVVAAVMAAFSVWVLWLNEFGQREHLFALAFTPYFLLRCLRQRGAVPLSRWQAAAIGGAAGLASALKPHFVLIAVAPELYWILRRRGRPTVSVELIAAGAALGAYAAHFYFLPDPIREAWFGRWVPMIAGGYHVYARPLTSLASDWTLWRLAAAAAVAIAATWRAAVWRTFGPPMIIVLGIAVANVFLQAKGWRYQALPGDAAAALAAALLISSVPAQRIARLRAGAVAASIVVCGAAAMVSAFLLIQPRTRDVDTRISAWSLYAREIVARTRPHDRVLVMSTGVSPAFPLLAQIERRPGSRYMFAFPLPMAYRGMDAPPGEAFDYGGLTGERAAIEQGYRAELIDDIRRHQPKVIIVDRSCQACPAGFSLQGYLQASGLARTVLAEYRELEGTAAGVYVRP